MQQKEITIKDCEELQEKFKRYCVTAEQHEFPMLIILNVKMDSTINHIKTVGRILNQKNVRAMFRAVLKFIGEDYSIYNESEYTAVRSNKEEL